uniref:Uncharacterized protein n=1 Tax=Triticum urartu TaxID=4572 RepID=A0A8R7QW41_TRIUA
GSAEQISDISRITKHCSQRVRARNPGITGHPFSGDRHDLLRRQLRTIRLWFLPSGMGPANLFILVLTTTAPLLSTSQPFNYSMAKPSMVWINNASSSYYDIPTVDP